MLFTFSRHVASADFIGCPYRTPASTTWYAGVHRVLASSIGRRPTSCQLKVTKVAAAVGTRYSVSTFDFQAGIPTKCLPLASADGVFVSCGSRTVKPL